MGVRILSYPGNLVCPLNPNATSTSILSYIVPVLRKGKLTTRYHTLMQSVSNTSNTFIVARVQTEAEQKLDVIIVLINERPAVKCYFPQSTCQRNSPPPSKIKTGRDTVMIPLLTHTHDAHHYHTPRLHNSRTAISLPPTLNAG